MSRQWGTINYYIDRLSSPTPPLYIDVCDVNVTDKDAFRLAEALTSEDTAPTLKKLRIRGSQITTTGFLALAEAVGGVAGSTSSLEYLDLGYTVDIAENVDDFAFGMYLILSAATNLKHLDLEGCYITQHAGMALAEILAVHGSKIETLNLCNNALEDDAIVHLAGNVSNCHALTKLDLGRNYIGSVGAKALAEYISTNPLHLQHLILWENSIGDTGANYFSKALKSNSTLVELNLGYNHLSSVGIESLLRAIFDTSSLNALVESNHTLYCLFSQSYKHDLIRWGRCDVPTLFDITNILQLNEVNTLIKQHSLQSKELPSWASDLPLTSLSIEQLKVVIYLKRCFDMKNFLDLDRTMLPQAIEFVGHNLGYDGVFHLIGQWNMPELFLS